MNIIPKVNTQVKLFHSSSIECLQKQTNEFVINKEIIDIKYNVLQDVNDYNCFNYSVLIIYTDYDIEIKPKTEKRR